MDGPLAVTLRAPVATIGANFAGASFALSGANPPDSDGAVGPSHFVELVNNVYSVNDKSGALLQQLPIGQFWSAAGVTPAAPTDPRILYDPESQRWFAAGIDIAHGSDPNPTAFLLAVSNTSDPNQGWKGFEFGQTFDFTELGVNKDGVYLSATNGAGGNIDFVAIPKSDLLRRRRPSRMRPLFKPSSPTPGLLRNPPSRRSSPDPNLSSVCSRIS